MVTEKTQGKINIAIETALKNINEFIDVNSVIGSPIKTEDGDIIIPISKVTVGVLVGGGEYGKIGIFKKGEDLPYSAGNGAVVSIKPSGFLIKDNTSYKLISAEESPSEKLIDKAIEIVSNMQGNI